VIPARSRECPREADVLEAVSMGRWPECADAELVAHVTSCPTCTDVAGISFALHDDRLALTLSAPVPASAIVWWRAQRRARAEAARAAARPLTIVQGIGAVCGLAMLVAAVAFASPAFAHWFGGLASLLPAADASTVAASSGEPSALRWFWPMAIGVCLIATPVAVYFAVRGDGS
jgi:hypothetical protein